MVAVDATTLYIRDLELGKHSMPRSDIVLIEERGRYWMVHGRSGERLWIPRGWPRRQFE